MIDQQKIWQCFIWVCFVFALLVMTRPINYYRNEFIGRGFHQMILPLFILFLYTRGLYHSKHIRNV